VNPEIDTGDIIISKELPVYRDDTYESLNYRIAVLAGELMASGVKAVAKGNPSRIPQDPDQGETLRVIPDDLLEEGRRRLEEGRYSHYAE
jgi:methionyl-tRNA formyltransferase